MSKVVKKDVHGGNVWEASRRSSRPLGGLLDFSASINPLGPPPPALRAVEAAIGLIPPYPDPGTLDLKEALAASHGIPAANILPANGSTELIYLIPRLFRTGRALVVEPAFSEYRKALALAGLSAEGFVLNKEDGFRLDLGRLRKRLAKGFALLFMANPANPTGVLYREDEMLGVIEVSRGLGVTAVLDEAFIDFSGGSVVKEAVKAKNAVVLRSMTKFYSIAGLRLGYAVANGRLINGLSRLMPPWSVNTLASVAGAASVADRTYEEKTGAWLRSEREFLSKGIASVNGLEPFPSSANYILVRITTGMASPALASVLFEKGILIRELSSFRGLGPAFFRVAVLGRAANWGLLGSLKEALGARRSGRARKDAAAAETA